MIEMLPWKLEMLLSRMTSKQDLCDVMSADVRIKELLLAGCIQAVASRMHSSSEGYYDFEKRGPRSSVEC